MCVRSLPRYVSEYWFLWCELEDFRYPDVSLVPLEDKETARLQHSETLFKPLAEHITPIGVQCAIFDVLPPCRFGALFGFAITQKVGRVEHDHSKTVIRVRHAGKVCLYIGLNLKVPPIAKGCFHCSDVLEQDSGVVLVKVEHLATATSVKDWFILHSSLFLSPNLPCGILLIGRCRVWFVVVVIFHSRYSFSISSFILTKASRKPLIICSMSAIGSLSLRNWANHSEVTNPGVLSAGLGSSPSLSHIPLR